MKKNVEQNIRRNKMKKKVIMAMVVVMAMATLPCFAEIRVDRGGYTENGFSCNVAIYWNDKYDRLSILSAKEQAMFVARKMRELVGGIYLTTTHIYIFHGVLYKVVYVQSEYDFQITVVCQYENGYQESLYNDYFFSSNAAKAQFDSLCQQYYNKISR